MKKLRRKRTGKLIGGVCAGLAEYFQTDVSIVRLIMVLLALLDGFGILFYLIAWVVIPEEEGAMEPEKEESKEIEAKPEENYRILGGLILIIIGTAFLLKNLFGFPGLSKIWPLFLIVFGIWMILMGVKSKSK